MTRRLLVWAVALFAFVVQVQAQDRMLSGKVSSSDDGSPLPGVNIALKGTTKGVTSDASGNFKISIPTGKATLIVSFIGFNKQEVNVSTQTSLDIKLSPEDRSLEEVVIVGYGTTLKKKEATGATSNVKGEVIENLPMQSFDRAIQGRSAGVQVLSNSGTPGGAVTVRIRGTGSITAGNEPLYIVDGVQMNNRNDGGGIVNTNPLAFLNPNDIESIDVLKDAATASIYGAQAANGVVIVTTKKGKAGKSKVEVNMYRGIVEPVPTLDVMNTQEFIQARIAAVQNNNPATAPATVRQNVLRALGFSADLPEADLAALPTYDWQKEAYQTGTVNNAEVSLTGGNDKTTFYASAAYNQQDASLRNISFERLSTNFKLTHKLNSKVTLESGINLSNVKQSGPYGSSDGTTAFGAAQYSAPILLPFNPIYASDGGFYGLPGSGVTIVGDLNQNVIASSEFIKRTGTTRQFVGNLNLTYKISESLSFKAFGGLDYRILQTSFFGDPRLQDYFANRGNLSEATNNNSNITTNYTLNYAKTFGKHSFGGLVGVEYRQEINEGTNYNAVGFPSPEFNTANAAAEPSSVGGFWTGFKRAGVFGNFRYDFNKKYLINATVRYDGSSRFGGDNQWGWFPSVAVKWNLAEEEFLKNSRIVSDLGFRGSVGSTGNDQIGNFSARRLYGLGGVYQGNSAIGPSQLGNPALRWERNLTYNAGLDYGLWGGRVKGAVDAFYRVSKDLLLSRSIPLTNGFGSIIENIGEVVNRGLEFEINTINIDRGKFRWETNFNITLQDNEVTKLFDGQQVLPGNLGIRIGYPINTNVAVPYLGVNSANGRPMWLDINDNITYLTRTADQRPMGHSPFTTMFGGFTNTFSYAGLELNVFFQYDYGRTIFNAQEFRLADNGGVLRNSLRSYFYDRWTTPGQITSVPEPADNRTEVSGRISSYQTTARFYQDASYIRLKQVTLGYNLPKTMVNRLKMSNVKIYAQAINLLTWSNWTGFDPEFVGDNQGTIPQSRNYTLGLQVAF